MRSERTKLVIGTRGSKLAVWQSEYVKAKVEEVTGLPVELKIIKTTGDKILDVPLAKVGGKGLFTKELEVELMAGTVDLCVHSMKDVPTELPESLYIAAMPERVDPRDAIVSGAGYDLDTLPQGAKLGTSSLRRRSQVKALRPDLEIVDVRGNLDTRMRKAEDGELDAVILASAGITRMGWADRITHYIDPEQMVSAVGQGAIGIEIREDDEFMRHVMEAIGHPETMECVTAERVVMNKLEGGCQVPIGAYARIEGDRMVMDGFVGSVGGETIIRTQLDGPADQPLQLGERMVAKLREMGADEVLAQVREAADVDDLEVRPYMHHLRPTAQARRAELRTLGQGGEVVPGSRDDHVARVDPLGHGRDDAAFGQLGGDVLHRVHAQVHGAREELHLELLCEQALATHLGERYIEDLVAGGLDDREAHRQTGDGLELGLDVLRLPQRELAAARADDESLTLHSRQRYPLSPSASRRSRAPSR